MALYEICTMLSGHRVSLISYGNFASDTAAILAARQLMRPGETLQIKCGEELIYRTGPVVRAGAAPPSHLLKWPVKKPDHPAAASPI